MGGPNGIGFGGNVPHIINTQGTENIGYIGGVQVDTTRPGAAPQNIPQHIDIRPQAQPSRAADVVGQLDVLLLKALNGASGEINAKDVEKAATKAKLPEEIRTTLKSLAETAQTSLAALDKFTGKDLAAAMEKNKDNSVDWKDGNMVAEAFKAALEAQQKLSEELANALGKAVNGNTQATLEELMLQCDRRVAELDTLVLQMAEIIDQGGENAQKNAAALVKGGPISSFKSADALDKFGRNEMFNALKSDLQPLTDRLTQYANDGAKDLSKTDVKACVSELNAIKAKFSAAAASGTLTVGTKTVFVDRSLLAEASKMLDGVGTKINSIHREILHEAMVKLVENEIPFVDYELFSPKFADEIGNLLNSDPKIKPKALGDYVKLINTFRSAARTYVESPTKQNATRLSNAATDLVTAETGAVEKCLTVPAILSFKAPANASNELKDALIKFQSNAVKGSKSDNETPIKNLIRSYDNINRDRHADNYMISVAKGVPSVDIKAIDNDASYGIFRQGLNKFVMPADMSMELLFRESLDNLAKCITFKKQDNESNYDLAMRIQQARDNFTQSVLDDPGVSEASNGTITIDLSKAKNPFVLKSLLGCCGIKNVAPPEEIDQKLYDKLMTLAKNAPDGGAKRKEYLSSLALRLGKSSKQYKAAVLRLDESIAHAKKLKSEGKVYKEEDWENHDIQRKIAVPNIANMEQKLNTYDPNINENKAASIAHKGEYSGYTNNFFRDFYSTIIKGSNHENWFLPEHQ